MRIPCLSGIRLFFSVLLLLSIIDSAAASTGCCNVDSSIVVIRQVTLIGNERTREGVIYRELSFAVGDTIAKADLKATFSRSENNLINTRLFNSATVNWIEDHGEVHAYVLLSERWYLFPIPIFEVAERNFNTWWQHRDFSRVVYGMSLSWRNVSGRNDVITSSLRLGYTQRMSLGYSLPNIDRRKRFGIGLSGFYLRNREVQLETVNDQPVFFKQEGIYSRKEYGGGVGISFRPGLYESHTAELFYRKAFTTDTAVKINPDYFTSGDSTERYFSLRYSYRVNHLDISVYPTKGSYVEIELNQSGFKFLKDDIHLLSATVRYKRFWQLSDRWFGAGGFTGKLSGDEWQPYYNTRGLGYNRDVIRGYEYYVIDGQDFALFKSGLRYSLLPRKEYHAGFVPSPKFNSIPLTIYAGIFADGGYVHDRQFTDKNNLSNRWQFGYGAGLDLFTYYDMVFRFEYSFNKLGKSGFFVHFTAPI